MREYQSIETIDFLGQTNLLQTLQVRNKPLVIKGLVNNWPLTQFADQPERAISSLLKSAAQQYVYVNKANQETKGRFFYTDDFTDKNFSQSPQLLTEFLTNLLSRTKPNLDHKQPETTDYRYMASTSVEYCFPGLLTEHPLPISLPSPLVSAWLGTQSVAATHFDVPQNIVCNVLGQRRFTLFPPEQLDNLYIGPLDFTPAGQPVSLVNVSDPDLSLFPKFATAIQHGFQVTLCPGDALYIPSMWWHNVEALQSVNLLFNYWWQDTPTYLGAPMDALKHAILSIKSLSVSERKAWQKLFNHYVFEHEQTQLDHIPTQALGMLDRLVNGEHKVESHAQTTIENSAEMRARAIRADLLKALNK